MGPRNYATWDRGCRSTDPSPMRPPVDHHMGAGGTTCPAMMRSAESLRSVDSMRSVDSVLQNPACNRGGGGGLSSAAAELTSLESVQGLDLEIHHHLHHHHHHQQQQQHQHQHHHPVQQEQHRSAESVRTSMPDPYPVRPMSTMEVLPPTRTLADQYALSSGRPVDRPCRLLDHHVCHGGAALSRGHGCHSVEHVHRAPFHLPHICGSRAPVVTHSCRSLDCGGGGGGANRPLPLDSVIFGPHTHPPLPAIMPSSTDQAVYNNRLNCPVHSPYRFRMHGDLDFHPHQQVTT